MFISQESIYLIKHDLNNAINSNLTEEIVKMYKSLVENATTNAGPDDLIAVTMSHSSGETEERSDKQGFTGDFFINFQQKQNFKYDSFIDKLRTLSQSSRSAFLSGLLSLKVFVIKPAKKDSGFYGSQDNFVFPPNVPQIDESEISESEIIQSDEEDTDEISDQRAENPFIYDLADESDDNSNENEQTQLIDQVNSSAEPVFNLMMDTDRYKEMLEKLTVRERDELSDYFTSKAAHFAIRTVNGYCGILALIIGMQLADMNSIPIIEEKTNRTISKKFKKIKNDYNRVSYETRIQALAVKIGATQESGVGVDQLKRFEETHPEYQVIAIFRPLRKNVVQPLLYYLGKTRAKRILLEFSYVDQDQENRFRGDLKVN